jgi:predicted lipoprotein with Yx(FWY)xxD motif
MSTLNPNPGRWRATAAALASGALLLTALAAGPAAAQSPAAGDVTLTSATASGITGNFLTGQGGMTLYYFTPDSAGTSVCTDKCAGFWPPLVLADGQAATPGEGVTGVVGTIARADGSMQVTYDGRALYYFSKDTAAGDVLGQDVGEIWFVAAVDGSVPPAEVYPIALGTGAAATFLTGEDGKTLYFFSKDTTPGVSTCTGDCLTAWPPFLNGGRDVFVAGDGVTGVIGQATQADGSKQVTYDGRPLYYWQGDAAAGDVTGQGVGGFVAATVDGAITAP